MNTRSRRPLHRLKDEAVDRGNAATRERRQIMKHEAVPIPRAPPLATAGEPQASSAHHRSPYRGQSSSGSLPSIVPKAIANHPTPPLDPSCYPTASEASLTRLGACPGLRSAAPRHLERRPDED